MTDLLKKLTIIRIVPDFHKTLPESAGIYVFIKEGSPIYIGKAINLRRRVSSYFDLDLEVKTARMIKEAREFSYIQVTSELEALLLEARLIRTYMPKYNIAAKDDKHPLYIQITKEKYPRVITARKINLKKNLSLADYGPFPSSTNVRSVLKMIRRIFPYSDHKIGKRACLYSHLGLCDPCPNEISNIKNQTLRSEKEKIYYKNVRRIKSILDGRIEKVVKNLNKDMEKASESEDFEKAGSVRDQIGKLEYITSPQLPTEFYMQNPNLYEDIRTKELLELSKLMSENGLSIDNLNRIECFDIAHLSGTSAAASMVTFINGEPDKTFYRHFRIKQGKRQSDVDSMKEVITRRLMYLKDWGMPDLMMVDGGVAQVNVFVKILNANKINIPVAGIAKNPDRLVIEGSKIKLLGSPLYLVSRIRNEAHRFAARYHHLMVSKGLIGKDL
mgnify:CR=1 FL=1